MICPPQKRPRLRAFPWRRRKSGERSLPPRQPLRKRVPRPQGRPPRPLPRRLRKRSSLPRPNRQRPLFPMCRSQTSPGRKPPRKPSSPPSPCRPPSRGIMGPMARWAMDTACLPSRAGASRPIPRGCGSRPPGPRMEPPSRGPCRPRGLPQGDSPPWGDIPCLPRAQPSPPPSRPGRKWAWG